jgi:enoyl-CoA hydratase/carnithine racemase
LTLQIHNRLEADGILLATIDMPGRSMNVFSAALMDELDALMDRVDGDPAVRSVVLTSGKPAFLAGADLEMIRDYTVSARTLNREQLFELCGRLGRQFVRLEAQTKPWVAAVNGIAMGGGLELAMACRARLVTDDPRTLLGLPEVRWGLLPGAGGTQRLPRIVGFEAGLALLLSGRSMSPAEAVERGVFKAAVPPDRLLDEARALARSLQGRPWDAAAKFPHLAQADVPAHAPETVHALARQHGISDADVRDYPAYATIIDCVLLGARHPLSEATAIEMRQFLRLMIDPVAGNMVRTLFLNRQRADREGAAPAGLRWPKADCRCTPTLRCRPTRSCSPTATAPAMWCASARSTAMRSQATAPPRKPCCRSPGPTDACSKSSRPRRHKHRPWPAWRRVLAVPCRTAVRTAQACCAGWRRPAATRWTRRPCWPRDCWPTAPPIAPRRWMWPPVLPASHRPGAVGRWLIFGRTVNVCNPCSIRQSAPPGRAWSLPCEPPAHDRPRAHRHRNPTDLRVGGRVARQAVLPGHR